MLGAGVARARWLGLLGSVLLVASAEAGTYRFVDESGIVHYTNAPSDPRYRRLVGWPDPPPTPSRVSLSRLLARYADLIQAAAERHRVDRRLVEAVIWVESGGNPTAVSRKGARGLMQLMPQRSAQLGVRNPFDPRQNVSAGVRHLRALLDQFGDVTLALAAYNAGADAVRAHGGVPPYAETEDYVRRVRALYDGGEPLKRSWAVGEAPQRIYRRVAEDGTVIYTNVPPHPSATVTGRF